MGSGGGGDRPPQKIGGISGQGGGRKMPAVATSIGELIVNALRLTTFNLNTNYPDLRPTIPSSTFDTVWTATGGGSGQAGTGNDLEIFWVSNDSGVSVPVIGAAGGGGGWGATGGSAESQGEEFGIATGISGGILGAAGGKAIQTNGNAVTWLSGASRAYGVVG